MNAMYANEKEIKKCIIKINGKKIPFCYFYKFVHKGKYNINYSFPSELKNMSYMFCDCDTLTKIDLSNFDSQNITNMNCMFTGCHSLTNIDLSNFNTQNVIQIGGLFWGCKSLTNINLSNFNTQKLLIWVVCSGIVFL